MATAGEIAAVLDVSPGEVEAWIEKGCPARRRSGGWSLDPVKVAAWLGAQGIKPAPGKSNVRRASDTRRVAAALDVTEETVRRWVRDRGCPHSRTAKKHLRFDLFELKEWMAAEGLTGEVGRRPEKHAAPGGSDDEPVDLTTARIRKELALARKHELANALREGELLLREDVERGRFERIAAVKAGLLALSQRVAPRVVGLSLPEVRVAMDEEVLVLLGEFSRE